MADKKVSALVTRPIKPTEGDYLMYVGANTSGDAVPDNYRVAITDLLSNGIFSANLVAPSTNVAAPNSSVTLTVANTLIAASANSIAPTHQIKVTIGGVSFWLLASNVAPA